MCIYVISRFHNYGAVVGSRVVQQSVNLHNAITFQMLHRVVTFYEKWQFTNFGHLLQSNYFFLTRYYGTLDLKNIYIFF